MDRFKGALASRRTNRFSRFEFLRRHCWTARRLFSTAIAPSRIGGGHRVQGGVLDAMRALDRRIDGEIAESQNFLADSRTLRNFEKRWSPPRLSAAG